MYANSKENFINSFINSILSEFSGAKLSMLKDKLWQVAIDYDIQEIETTELSVHNGTMTDILFNYYEIGKRGAGIAESTIEQYRIAVVQLTEFCHKDLNLITSDDVLSFLYGYPKTHKVAKSTMDNKRRNLSSVFSYLVKHDKLAKNPMLKAEPIKHPKVVKVPLSDEEIERLRINCNDSRESALVDFLLDSAVRASELCNINLNDIDFQNYRVRIRNGKGDKDRFVSFSGKTMVRLRAYLNSRQELQEIDSSSLRRLDIPLFANKIFPYNRISKERLEQIIRTLGDRSKVEHVYPHLFRATCATRLSDRGVEGIKISKYLGHSNLNTLMHYIFSNYDSIDAEIRRVGFAS